jgi:hypothetical protein
MTYYTAHQPALQAARCSTHIRQVATPALRPRQKQAATIIATSAPQFKPHNNTYRQQGIITH